MRSSQLPGFQYANWTQGYGDFHMVPDLSSLSICGWAEGTAIVLCDSHNSDTHELVPIAPRSILRTQLEKLKTLTYNEQQTEDKKKFIVVCLFSNLRCVVYGAKDRMNSSQGH